MKRKMIFMTGLIGLVWAWGSLFSLAQAQEKVLRIYGPGGPLAPMKECAELFSKAEDIQVQVTAGPESKWIDQAKQDADLIFGGAEYMLSQFMLKYPDLVDEKTWTSLYIRPAGILVRKGNPKNIRSLADLTQDGLRIIDVAGAGQLGLWEDLAGARGLIPGIRKNSLYTVGNSAEAIEKWKAVPEIAAWITYESWHFRLPEITDLVTFPDNEKIFRGTPIAATRISKNQGLALRFIDFLKTDPAHKVFQKWGWK